jgi:hypothetical protein
VLTPIPFILPRRFPTIVTIVFSFLAVGIWNYSDFLVGAPPIDLYDANDSSTHELFDIVYYYLNVPFSYIFVYLFDKWKIHGIGIVLYIISWSLVAVAYEGLTVYLHVYKYKGWTLGYSLVYYLAVQSFYLLLYYVIKHKYNQTKRETGPEWT